MRKWGRARHAAWTLTTPVVACVLCCGPQTVPAPTTRYMPATAGVVARGVAGRAGSAPVAGNAIAGRAAVSGGAGGTVVYVPVAAGGGGAPVPVAGAAPPIAGAGIIIPPVGTGAAGVPAAAAGSVSNPVGLPPFDAGTDPNRNNVQAGALCARISQIECAAEAHCCLNPGRAVSACQAEIMASCVNELYLDHISATASTNYNPTIASAVFAELETRSASCDVGVAEWSLGPQGVRRVFQGSIAPNTSCKPLTDATEKPVAAAALFSCTNTDTTACLPKSALGDWTCAPKGAVGSNCVTDDNCQAGLYCSNPEMRLLGKCAQRLQLGAACLAGNDCVSLFCSAARCVAADTQVAFCLKGG